MREEVIDGFRLIGIHAGMLFGFIILTVSGMDYLVEGENNLLSATTGLLPIICWVASMIFVETTQLIKFLFALLLLPFQLLGIGRKKEKVKEAQEERAYPRSYGSSSIVICVALYAMAAKFLIDARNIDFPFWVYCFIGLCWGLLLYGSFQRGTFDDPE
ncbi:MAG: hypothetical protein AAFV95_19710 [Bacteroidota bacterium]